MKFAEHLAAHITPEWRKQYIEYEKMKEMLYEAQETAPSAEETDPAIMERHFAKFHEKFFRFCDLELKKINIFFSEKLAESTRKLASLKSDLDQLIDRHHESHGGRGRDGSHSAVRRKAFSRKTHHDLKLAYSEFYLNLILVQNYQTLNFTGFRKILKKHDKLFETKSGAEWRQSKVETSLFFTSRDVDSAIEQVENIVTAELESGDRGKAMKRLRVPPLGETQNPLTTFRVGLYLGITTILIVIAVIAAFYVQLPLSWQLALRLYRGPVLIILFFFLIGGNTYGWRTSGVNHVLIFELDPRHHLTYQQFLEVGGMLAVVWGVGIILFLFSPFLGIPLLIHPLWMCALMLLYLLNPLPILHHQSRRWLLNVLFRMATAPFHHVGFADFWMADQFNSLAMVLVDFQYFVCFFASEVDWSGPNALRGPKMEAECVNGTFLQCSVLPDGTFQNPCGGLNLTVTTCRVIDQCATGQYGIRPIITALPAWWRFAQCWRRYRDTGHAFPHVVNAFKYSTSFLVITFSALNTWYKGVRLYSTPENAFFWLWMLSAIVSSCYTYAWDIKMDWGLLDKNAGDNRFLREQTVYRYKWYYYLAMIQDLILRFTWTVTITATETGFTDSEILRTITGVLEVVRRFIWNFFRLENEHVNNCGQFRAVRDIFIAPIDHSDQVLLEKMMDEEDGVTNRREKDARRDKFGLRKRTWADDDEDEQTDTWTVFKGGISNWLQSRKISSDRKASVTSATRPKEV